MKPILSRRNLAHWFGEVRLRSTPATSRVPLLGASMAPTRFRSVVLPLPDGPRTTTNCPSSMVSEASASTAVRIGPWSYHLLTLTSRTREADDGAVAFDTG